MPEAAGEGLTDVGRPQACRDCDSISCTPFLKDLPLAIPSLLVMGPPALQASDRYSCFSPLRALDCCASLLDRIRCPLTCAVPGWPRSTDILASHRPHSRRNLQTLPLQSAPQPFTRGSYSVGFGYFFSKFCRHPPTSSAPWSLRVLHPAPLVHVPLCRKAG